MRERPQFVDRSPSDTAFKQQAASDLNARATPVLPIAADLRRHAEDRGVLRLGCGPVRPASSAARAGRVAIGPAIGGRVSGGKLKLTKPHIIELLTSLKAEFKHSASRQKLLGALLLDLPRQRCDVR